MNGSSRPLVSVVVPTYNEEHDIRRTLEALVCLTYPSKEIIVVDDSTDGTPAIVKEFARSGVALVRGANTGRCGARNIGIRRSRGDIVVVLNSDVCPREDFLERILPHYGRGADYVLVDSEIANQESLFPRYLEALGRFNYDGQDWIEWTEGFSCRREAALAVGLFPEGFPIPLCAGEDAVFGHALRKRYRKVIDRSIVVPHIAPASLKEFWDQQSGRGRGASLIQYYVEGRSRLFLMVKLLGKLVYCPLSVLARFPWFFRHYLRRGQAVNRGWSDCLPFLYASLVELAAQRVGEWSGWLAICRAGRWVTPRPDLRVGAEESGK